MAEGADAAQWRYHDGSLELVGEIFEPRGEPNGQAVLVMHEADGIGGNVRRHARGLADLGYITAAADMHGKGRPPTDPEIPAALALAAIKNDAGFFRRRVRSAYAALKDRYRLADHAIGAIGYCFGGTAVLELARDGVLLGGVASFHGLLTTAAPAMPGAVRAGVLACTGWRDPSSRRAISTPSSRKWTALAPTGSSPYSAEPSIVSPTGPSTISAIRGWHSTRAPTPCRG